MANNYYIAPFELVYAIGGGRFALTNPGNGRAIRASRVAVYGTWDQTRGTRLTTIKGGGAAGFGKTWSLARVQDENPALGLIDYAALDADPSISRLPVGPDVLGREFGTFAQPVQDAIIARLEALRLPANLIQPTTTIRQIVGYIIRVLFCAQQLGVDFPELDLSATWASVPLAQRQRVLTWAQARGVSTTGLNNQSSMRVIVARLLTAEFGRIEFGGELF